MAKAYVFWTILGTVAGVGLLLVVGAYVVWKCYLRRKSKEIDDGNSFFEEITETQIKTVTSRPSDGAMVVTQNVRTRTLSSRPRDRRGSKDWARCIHQEGPSRQETNVTPQTIIVAPWSGPSLMNNWRDSEEDFVKQMSKTNFKELTWKPPISENSPRFSKSQQSRKAEEKVEIIEL